VSRRPVAVIALAVVAALGALTLGVTGAPFVARDVADRASAPVSAAPAAGGSVCVTGADASDPDAELLLVAAPPGPPGQPNGGPADGAADAGGPSARGVVLTLAPDLALDADASGARRAFGPLEPGALELLDVVLGAEGWLWAGWADRPVAAWQEWRAVGAPGEPRGSVASACLPTDPPVQTVVGLRTDGGHEALLRLANPFEADATFAIAFITEDGPFEPVGLRNVSVPAGERVTVRLNDHVPEQSDVAAVVTVGAGRLAVEGLQRSVAAIGGIEGVTAVPPVTAPAVAWTFPWVPVGPDVESSLWVLNPEPRAVVVQIIVHTPQGATVPLDDGIEVGAGALVRIDAADLPQDLVRAIGVTLRSATTGVIAGSGAAFLAEDAARTGLVRMVGAPLPDPEWTVAGVAAPDRDTVLHVVNLAETDAVLRIALTTLRAPVDGAASGPDAARPERRTVIIEPGRLAPGATARVILPLDGAVAFSAIVDGGEALVVARTTIGRELLEPVAMSATASRTWRTVGPPLAGRPLSGWVTRLGTSSTR
jgi:hypothetical protein